MLEQSRESTPQSILQSVFGYDAFRGNQQAVIDVALAGKDTLVLMPTGGGKSICYQIPALLFEGLTIVVSPLIALMQDQVDALEQLGVQANFLNSTLSSQQQNSVIQEIKDGTLRILYIAPERLLLDSTLTWLADCSVSLIAIDEAHCVSQWGHDFRADYLSLSRLKNVFPGTPRMALTATATPRSREDIVQQLDLDSPDVFVSSFDRPNIHYAVSPKNDSKAQLAKFLSNHHNEAGIVYCLSRKSVENTADWLNAKGLTALPYHAGLRADLRKKNQARFLREDGIIIVATIAFGMGIDKPDVRFVAHMNLPKSMEAYYQETGRAGRDGLPSATYMLYGLDDIVQLNHFIERNDAPEDYKIRERRKLDGLLGWCETSSCRRVPLLDYFGENQNRTDVSSDAVNQACGNCDNCNSQPETWDATVAAQKLLSTIYRTGQRFGASHLIDILRGKDNEKIRQFEHQQLSVYGIGEDLSQVQWRSLVRQLITSAYLAIDTGRYNSLQLTESSRQLLKGEIELKVRKDVIQAKKDQLRKKPRNESQAADPVLWDALRERRKQLAQEHNIAPYMVFHDATLMEMMELRPMTSEELLTLNGVGEAKLTKFGDAFLDVLRGDNG